MLSHLWNPNSCWVNAAVLVLTPCICWWNPGKSHASFIAPFFAWIVKTRQGARKDQEFQSRLRVMDIDEARGADLVCGLLLCRYNHDQTNSLC